MKTLKTDPTPCPSCGKPTPAGALAGLCPACLLAQGEETAKPGGEPGHRFEPPPLEEIARLFPQLEILALLGAGGMGAVYKARQPELDRIVALKVLPATAARGASFEERFNREARALARLNHPGIVAVFEFGRVGGEAGPHFFIMEFVDGANLRQLEKAGNLSPREALRIIPQICDALQYAHDEGVVHRDIKPENVLVDRKGRVKIADFGLAKTLGAESESTRLTAEGQVMGTPHYMAPEQVARPLAVDHRADIYALGVVFYEMLTGDLPLGKFPPPSRKYQLDVRLDEVVLRALENDPARRYQHANEVKTQVENIAGSPAPAAKNPEPERRYLRWMGFPLAVEAAGARRTNWKGALQAFGIFFGLLTIPFGLVTLATGKSLFGWVGVVGWKSVAMRLLIAAGFAAVGVRRALGMKAESEPAPEPPQSTVVLAQESFSRKAIIGAVWAALLPVALGMWFTSPAAHVRSSGDQTSVWVLQWALIFTILLPGLAAPLGTTLMGWLGVADIRRAGGRIGGLPLALFDGLVFPLLLLDYLVVALFVSMAGGNTRFGPLLGGNRQLAVLLGIGAALWVDWLVARRVWNAVRLDGPRRRKGEAWWWNGKKGAVAIGIACLLLVLAASGRRERDRNGETPAPEPGAAIFDSAVVLPNGAAIELLALAESATEPGVWWRPDGSPLMNTAFQVWRLDEYPPHPKTRRLDLVFRLTGTPPGTEAPVFDCDPSINPPSGGEVTRDGRKLEGGWALRSRWAADARSATLRFGYGLEPWRTVLSRQPENPISTRTANAEDPDWMAEIEGFTDTEDGMRIAARLGPESLAYMDGTDRSLTLSPGGHARNWRLRIVALDKRGQERVHDFVESIPVPETGPTEYMRWNFRFPGIKKSELQAALVQVEPLYWVEFKDVALYPRRAAAEAAGPAKFGETVEVSFKGLLDLDNGRQGDYPEGGGQGNVFDIGKNLAWMQTNGFDIEAGGGSLNAVGTVFAPLGEAEWNTLAPEELGARVREKGSYLSELTADPQGRLPATFGFRTREGGVGMLQIVSYRQGKIGATIRYKLLQPGQPE